MKAAKPGGKFGNQSILITGASSGIGEALALELARQGASLTLAARREDRLRKLAQTIEAAGGHAQVVRCDVTREGDLEKAVASARERYGKLDVAIANAGFGVVGKFEELDIEDYRRQFETNVFGVLRTAYAALPELRKSHGTLVLMGSVAGHVAMPGASPYSMSKFSVRALAETLRYELLPQGVSVVLISPGYVRTEIHRVDNQGTLHEDQPHRIPDWIRMPADQAARQMVRAIARKQGERVVTVHGKTAVFIQRHMPWMLNVLKGKKMIGRSEPT